MGLHGLLYILEADDFLTLQETHLQLSTACYGESLNFYMQMMFTPHRKHTYESPRPVTGVALLFYMQVMFVPHREHTYWSPRPVTAVSLLFYMQMIFVPHWKYTYWSPRPVTRRAALLLHWQIRHYYDSRSQRSVCALLRPVLRNSDVSARLYARTHVHL
jgi:hypothetical protein